MVFFCVLRESFAPFAFGCWVSRVDTEEPLRRRDRDAQLVDRAGARGP